MIWLVAAALPLLAACALAFDRTRAAAVAVLIPLSPLPALGIALVPDPPASAGIEWLLLHAHFGFGETGQVMLLLTALLWTVAGFYASAFLAHDARRVRFFLFFALTMCGNLGLVMAQDLASFYTFFALMTFSAYGLVVHSGSGEAYRAGRVYLVAAIFGEVLLLGAVLLVAAEMDSLLLREVRPAVAASESRDLIMVLAFGGFGVKAGAAFVHFWLPLAYSAAPLPAAAVLSGAMSKAGLIGWLHFLPFGAGSFPAWSAGLVLTGSIAAFGAVLIGLTQRDPKTVLAYSSVSQMGVITVALGIALLDAALWPLVLPAVTVFALNHALSKSALFLGVGIATRAGSSVQRALLMAGLALAALAIAGAPWTGGAIAKHAAKAAFGALDPGWYDTPSALIVMSSTATALLLTHFFARLSRAQSSDDRMRPNAGLLVPWVVVTACAALAVPMTVRYFALEVDVRQLEVWAAAWPVALGVALFAAVAPLLRQRVPAIPAGDIVVLLEWSVRRAARLFERLPVPQAAAWQLDVVRYFQELGASEEKRDPMRRMELRLLRWENAVLAFAALVLAFALLLMS